MSQLFNKKVIYGGIFLTALTGCAPEKTSEQTTTATTSVAQTAPANHQLATAEITNANDFALQQEAIYFPFYDLGITADDAAVQNLNVLADGVAQASQSVDTDGEARSMGCYWQPILILLKLNLSLFPLILPLQSLR